MSDEDKTPITIKQACELLHMERPNFHKLIRRGEVEDMGFMKTVGSSWRHMVSKESVLEYSQRKLDYGSDRAVFKMDIDLTVYEKVCNGLALDPEEADALREAFQAASNETVRMAEYHAQHKVIRQGGQGDDTTDLSSEEEAEFLNNEDEE